MKVSIITATYNSEATFRDTCTSVLQQQYTDIEHIVVDGGSSDGTVNIIKEFPHIKKWVSEKDKGLYHAINKGIAMAEGDIIGILNSDDILASTDTIGAIVETFKDASIDAIYGDIVFVDRNNTSRVIRHYSSGRFSKWMFRFGIMPAHPSFYVRSDLYKKLGVYKENYRIAADYELLMRFMRRFNISTRYLSRVIVYMRTGGVSNENLRARYALNKEIVKACEDNGVSTNMAFLTLKYFVKVFEFVTPLLKGQKK